MDKIVKGLHPRMRRFVSEALDLINLNKFFENYMLKGGIMDGYHFHIHLIRWFLNLRIDFDRDYHREYEHIRFVKDLPEKDIKDCLFYLNYLMGTTSYTGGHDYVMMYESIRKDLSS